MKQGFLMISLVLFLPHNSDKRAKLTPALWLRLPGQRHGWVYELTSTNPSSHVLPGHWSQQESLLLMRPSADSGMSLNLGQGKNIWGFMHLACFPHFGFRRTISYNHWFVDLFNICVLVSSVPWNCNLRITGWKPQAWSSRNWVK